MRKYLLTVLAITVACFAMSSCKLDPPILPGDPNYVAYTPPENSNLDTENDGAEESAIAGTVTGTTGTGAGVNNSNLTGVWTAKTTTSVIYDQNNIIVTSVGSSFNIFDTVTFDDAAKSCDLVGGIAANPNTYTLSTTDNNLYILFPEDPFNRSGNEKIQVTNLSANAMTWLAPDPLTTTVNGQTMHTGYLLTFTR